MDVVLAVFALLFLLFVGLGAYATVKAVGAAKRGVDRSIAQARRTVEDHTLRAKSFVQPGPAGEIAQLRLALRTSMRATQEILHAGSAEDESLKESLGLFERLSAHGHELDADLKRLETEPDRAALAERLPELRSRTERITSSADSLRWAVHDRTRRFADDDLGTLSAQIDIETGALRHWTRTEPGQVPPQWPDASAPAAADHPATQRTRPTASGSPTARPAPDAIAPPSWRPASPWQKKPRPESTT
ncbi:hypothetical protein GCM10018980_47420 [Streptomyces capoamus]|uniref:Secreted protein n=1 Tax=Streptomyces capoamus TaxID=68183 RepID=A0A919EYS3_9ACTN|nr:hypothetical protein [Streptomyces capoamus]GGW18343.1 hypothetical protein GCM10010501_44990 [Streptomyces libani subsp. rufus]GHG59518.1 hypothetical protein GCM10018980_47420 [Streptomyces capoamus]